jgi:hypothetical protein
MEILGKRQGLTLKDYLLQSFHVLCSKRLLPGVKLIQDAS